MDKINEILSIINKTNMNESLKLDINKNKKLIVDVTSMTEESNRLYEIYSTYEYADKISNKKSIPNLSALVENLRLKNGIIKVISFNFRKKSISVFLFEKEQIPIGFILS